MACMVCDAAESRVLFNSCRHLVTCVICAQSIAHCPKCLVRIVGMLEFESVRHKRGDAGSAVVEGGGSGGGGVGADAAAHAMPIGLGGWIEFAESAARTPQVLPICDGVLEDSPLLEQLAKARLVLDWVARNMDGTAVVNTPDPVWRIFGMDDLDVADDVLYWEILSRKYRQLCLDIHPDKHAKRGAQDVQTFSEAMKYLPVLRDSARVSLGEWLVPSPKAVSVLCPKQVGGNRMVVVKWESSESSLAVAEVSSQGIVMGRVECEEHHSFVVTEAEWPDFFQEEVCALEVLFEMVGGPLAGARSAAVVKSQKWPTSFARRIESVRIIKADVARSGDGAQFVVTWRPPAVEAATVFECSLANPPEVVEPLVIAAGVCTVTIDRRVLQASALRLSNVTVYHEVIDGSGAATHSPCQLLDVKWPTAWLKEAQCRRQFPRPRNSPSPPRSAHFRPAAQTNKRKCDTFDYHDAKKRKCGCSYEGNCRCDFRRLGRRDAAAHSPGARNAGCAERSGRSRSRAGRSGRSRSRAGRYERSNGGRHHGGRDVGRSRSSARSGRCYKPSAAYSSHASSRKTVY